MGNGGSIPQEAYYRWQMILKENESIQVWTGYLPWLREHLLVNEMIVGLHSPSIYITTKPEVLMASD